MVKKIIKWTFLTVIIAGLGYICLCIFSWPILDFLGRSREKYKVTWGREYGREIGMEIKWVPPERAKSRPDDPFLIVGAKSLHWVTGFNYTDKYLYGKTTVRWFVIAADEKTGLLDKLILFYSEGKFKNYLAERGVQVKELIEVPVFEAPELSNGYQLTECYPGLRLSRGGIYYAHQVNEFGIFGDFIIGKGIKGDQQLSNPENTVRWFIMDMGKEKIIFNDNLKEIAALASLKTEEINAGLQKIPDLFSWNKKYPLPFKHWEWGAYSLNSSSLQIIYRGPNGDDIAPVHFIVRHKRQNGYIFGKTRHEYFIFNTADEKTRFFDGNKEADWLAALAGLKLEPKDFESYSESDQKRIAGYETPPWLDPGEHYTWATHVF